MAEQRSQRDQTLPPFSPFPGRGGPGARMMGPAPRPKNARATVLRLWGYLRRQRRALIVTALMVVGTTGLNLLGPYLLGRAIDAYILRGDLPGLVRLLLLMAGVYTLTSLLTWLQSYVMAGAAQRAVRDIRNDLFRRMQTLQLRFFDQRAHGDLMSRLTNDVENVNQVLTDGVTQIVSGVLTTVGIAVVMFWINPVLAAVSILTVTLLTLGLNRWVATQTREGFRRQQASLGKLNGLIEETVTGQRVVKAYHKEQAVVEQFGAANRDLRQAATRAQIYAGFVGPLMNFVSNLGLAIVAGVGGLLVLRGLASVGTIATCINYTRQFGRPLNEIANLYNLIQAAVAGAERVFEVIDEEPEVDAPDARPLARIGGDVAFDDVSFSYTEGVPVLKHISLHAQPGQIVALVGPTGAGKTTIVNLLTRFYEVDSGLISIDGQDIRRIRKEDLRRQLGIVLQDTFLFSGSMMDNIRYGRLDASDEEVIAAAKLANADQFIHRLPRGYDTQLSERGGNLSQGQRQMLAIARAILADPSILILDEATSSVDTRTEKHIQEAMLRLMSGRTSFVIAHRLSTILDANQILVIDAGEIIERGTHEELLECQGFYHNLYISQFRATGRLVQRGAQEALIGGAPEAALPPA
ncbi:MAG: ABC transporter ATP-binding protein/permease [Chloroflexota bacterium]|nr:ABC transporter ATP-binding protein/permease [Chloroflexota bacterium]